MSGGMPELGSKISLISKADIRYEGRLYTVDPQECTIALSNVRSFGTEDRDTQFQIAPQSQIYDYILFRGSDIKDIRVVNNNLPHPNDPAIMQVQLPNGQHIMPHFPMPAMNPPHVPPMGNSGYGAFGGMGPLGLGGGAQAGPSLAPGSAPAPFMLGNQQQQQQQPQQLPKPQQQPQQQQQQPKQPISVIDMLASASRSTTPISLVSRKSPSNDLAMNLNHQQQQPPQQQVQQQQPPQHQKPQMQQQQMSQQQHHSQHSNNNSHNSSSSNNQHMMDGGNGGGGGNSRDAGHKRQNYQHRNSNNSHNNNPRNGGHSNDYYHQMGGGGGGQHHQRDRRDSGRNMDNYQQQQHQQQQHHDMRNNYNNQHRNSYQGGGGNNGPNRAWTMHRGTNNPNNMMRNRGGGNGGPRGRIQNQGFRQMGGNMGGLNQNKLRNKNTIKFEQDFDFEQANNKFEELRSLITKLQVGDDAKSEQCNDEGTPSTIPTTDPPQMNGEPDKKDDSGNETGAGEHEPEDDPITVGYDKTKSFFDNISCEAAQDRSKNKKNDWRQERKLNSETFGVSSTRRGGYRGRGNYYNRNAGGFTGNYMGGGGGGMGGYNRGYRYRNRSDNRMGMGNGMNPHGGSGGNSNATSNEDATNATANMTNSTASATNNSVTNKTPQIVSEVTSGATATTAGAATTTAAIVTKGAPAAENCIQPQVAAVAAGQ